MRKLALIVGALLLVGAATVSAQDVLVQDNFTSMRAWTVGYGDWSIRGGMLSQKDTDTGLARIDRRAPQNGEYEISFNVRYLAGGFEDQMALRNQQFHAGFGIHVGVTDPPLGRIAWGNNDSYLLWLNLDTRRETARNTPQHLGFRGQVYDSTSNSKMSLTDLNVDIQAALAQIGVDLGIQDIDPFLYRTVPIRIRVNTDTGRIMVNDPTAPRIWFYFDVDPAKLDGNYISLRTNSLALGFSNFQVVQR
jgi:hypothetical protein